MHSRGGLDMRIRPHQAACSLEQHASTATASPTAAEVCLWEVAVNLSGALLRLEQQQHS
jgi:hypothetical protein